MITAPQFYAALDATWPPADMQRQGPWLIREGRGGGQRVSAASAVTSAAAAVNAADITQAEAAMQALGQVPLFMIRDGEIMTTPIGGSILGGITRDTIVKLAQERDLVVKEMRFTRDMLYVADEVFVVGTAAEVTPIREIDNRKIGNGTPGPLTQALQSAYFDLVKGNAEGHSEWLTYVN